MESAADGAMAVKVGAHVPSTRRWRWIISGAVHTLPEKLCDPAFQQIVPSIRSMDSYMYIM